MAAGCNTDITSIQVGDVRDYKWINTVNKCVWRSLDTAADARRFSVQSFQQLSLAVEYNATRVWILNVGDFKATEMPTDFFLSMAYNASALQVSVICGFIKY